MKTFNDNIFNFENLEVYKKMLDYIDLAYAITGRFPQFEKFELGKQFRKASTSIALNLGEGEGGSPKEYLNFIRISKRSVQECLVCTTIAHRRQYISLAEAEDSRQRLTQIAKMLRGLAGYIQKKIPG